MSLHSQSLFKQLPVELQQMIFHYLLTENGSDVVFELNQDGNLQGPAFPILKKLESTDQEIYENAVMYLGNLLRVVFVSNDQPHRALLRTFRQQTKPDFRSSIKRIYLPKLTAVDWMPLDVIYFPIVGRIRNPKDGDHLDPYTRRFKLGRTEKDSVRRIYTDVRLGLYLLHNTFPSLQSLELGIDLLECLSGIATTTKLSERVMDIRSKSRINNDRMLSLLHLLAKHPGITEMDIRILWDDFLERGQNIQTDIPLTDELRSELQEYVLGDLRNAIPAKSITGHTLH